MLRLITKHRFSYFDLTWIALGAMLATEFGIVTGILVTTLFGTISSLILEELAR